MKVNFLKFINLLCVVVSELLVDSFSRYLLHPEILVWLYFGSSMQLGLGLFGLLVGCVNDLFVQFWKY